MKQIQTASVYIVNQRRVLLHYHKKYKFIMPIGGTIDGKELPYNTAIREALEETGIKIQLHDNKIQRNFKYATQTVRPVHIFKYEYPELIIIDNIFYASTDFETILRLSNESAFIKWYGLNELIHKDIPDNVRYCAEEAIYLYD